MLLRILSKQNITAILLAVTAGRIVAFQYFKVVNEWITGKCIERQYDTRNHRFALHQSHVHYL